MPKDGWLLDEFIKERLEIILNMRRNVKLKDFKLMFTIPVEDDRILQLAKECGFRVSNTHNCIVIELGGKGR